ncbi:MAG: TIGR04255 family protein [Caulobacter sp.]|nr:TIGR04255 family protein [Caulobacter sp.]
MSAPYAKPPVTEGIIEVRWSNALSDKLLQRIRAQAVSRFAVEEEESEVEIRFDGATPVVAEGSPTSYRYRSADATEILVVRRQGYAVSRLAPYTGWGDLSGRALDELARFQKIGWGGTVRTRLGVRYINRIDVPVTDAAFDPADYVLCVPPRPAILSAPAGDFTAIVARVPIGDYFANVTVSKQPSPIINHVGLIVDIDIYAETEAQLSRLGDELAAIRDVKNAVFEGMIRDRARELFQ